MAGDRRSRRERFARAVARPADLDGPQPPDEPGADLAAELAMVAMLRRHAADARPTATERDRMRRRVLAAAGHREPSRGGDSTLAPLRRRRGGVRRRLGIAVAAVFVLLAALSGLSVLLSQSALPGDPLYQVKRTVEEASLGFTFGEGARAMRHLGFAADRVREIRELADRSRDGSAPPVTAYRTALGAFDADTLAGSRALTTEGTSADASALDSLRHWARRQYRALDTLAGLLPAATVPDARQSVTLLSRVIARVGALRQRLGCDAITSGASDELGPLPATGHCAVPKPVVPDATTTPLPPGAPEGQAAVPRVPAITVPEGHRRAATGGPAGTAVPQRPALPTPTGPVIRPPAPTGAQPPVIPPPGTATPSPPTMLLPLPLHLGTLQPLLGLPGVRFG